MDNVTIKGRKGGGGGGHTPVESPDSVQSISRAKMLFSLGEGEFAGRLDGTNVYADGTSVLNSDGTESFPGFRWEFRPGTQAQDYIQGIPSVENEIAISTELKSGTPWVRAVSNLQLSAVRLRFGWPMLQSQADNGDVNGYRIEYAIDIATDGGSYQEVLTAAIDDKTTSLYERSHRINLPKASTGWQVRVRRLTPNANSARIADRMNIEALTEIIDAKLRYPNTALLYVEFDSKQFPNIPKISCKPRGRVIRVPDKEPWADGNRQKIYTPPDYVPGNPVFIVGQTGYIFGSATNPPFYGGVTGWRVDGNRIIVDFTQQNNQAFFTEFSIYQVQIPQSVSGTYGIMIQNSVDWMSINSEQRLGFVAWKGVVTINGQWTLPTVQNDNTKIVYVRCDDPGVSVYHSVEYNELTVSRDNGSGEPFRTSANVHVVIMNSGYYPPTPSGYGMVIKNAAGNNTFTSDCEPLLWDGRSVNVGANPDDLVNTGIARPMIPLAVNAFMRGNSEMSGGYYNYYSCGYRFNGSAVQFWRADSGRKIQTKWNVSTRWYSSQMPLMVINADHYF